MKAQNHYFLSFLFILWMPSLVLALPRNINPPGEKMVLVDPREHAWGAYTADGTLVRSGRASAGADWCPDMGQECHTSVGSFRVQSLGGRNCVSPSFPIPRGGAPMPYCMYFTEYQALHGSNNVRDANISHGCVRMHVADAAWLRFKFVELGTLVVIEGY